MTWRFSQMLRAVEDIVLKQFSYVVIVSISFILVFFCLSSYYAGVCSLFLFIFLHYSIRIF